jgi:hypothetical protein
MMDVHNDYDDESHHSGELNYYDESEGVIHKKRIRRMLEDRLDRKRLKEALEDFDGELDDTFDWEHIDR